jgi:tRNA (adenine57-N1/adenine58-N1)-methyltransferase
MDFARPHVQEESVASVSNIRRLVVPDANNDDEELDRLVILAANQAAQDILIGPVSTPIHIGSEKVSAEPDKEVDSLTVDTSYYKERSTPLQTTIQPGDLVVIMEAFDKLDFVYATSGAIFHNRNGHFYHDDFLGKSFGCKIRSRNNRGYGFCYLLKPTPELWTQSLNHRTQIVHELDQSQVIFQLNLRPNMVMIESGTGSGAMSHAILRSIAPAGKLHTFEFNQHRAETAKTEFATHGVQHLVQVYHKDVCAEGFALPHQSADACFLDLPEPWEAIPHAAYNMKPNARIATYSPCVEQTQKTVDALRMSGFHSLMTMEYRLQEHYVDEFECEPPPTDPRPILIDARSAEASKEVNEGEHSSNDHGSNDNDLVEEPSEKDATSHNRNSNKRKRSILVARPFVSMRGHTAFLTFATAGNRPQPNPLEQKSTLCPSDEVVQVLNTA